MYEIETFNKSYVIMPHLAPSIWADTLVIKSNIFHIIQPEYDADPGYEGLCEMATRCGLTWFDIT